MLGGLVSSGMVGPVRSRARRASLVLTGTTGANNTTVSITASGSLGAFGAIAAFGDVTGRGLTLGSTGTLRHGTNYSGIWEMNSSLYLNSGASSFGVTTGAFHFGPAGNVQNPDVFLRREAAGILSQRNVTNPQTSRTYGTYTSSTSFELLQHRVGQSLAAFPRANTESRCRKKQIQVYNHSHPKIAQTSL